MLKNDPNGQFVVVGAISPKGYKRGVYYYVMHTATGAKVSRYLRKPASAIKRARKYTAMYAAGDHYWPEVDRCDERRTNPDAVPTLLEYFFGQVACYE